MGFEIADLRQLGQNYAGKMIVYLAAGSNPINAEGWANYVPEPGFILNTERHAKFDILNVLSSPDKSPGEFTFYTDYLGFTWQSVAAVQNVVYPFNSSDYPSYDPPLTAVQAGYVVTTPIAGTIQYNSNDKNHENIYFAYQDNGVPALQHYITDPWGNRYILKSTNARNDAPEEIASAVASAVLPNERWLKSSGYLAEDTTYVPVYSGSLAHANEFRDSSDNAWMQITWGDSGITLAAVIGEGLPIWGGNSNDLVLGTAAADQIHGGGGHDHLQGFSGDDVLFGDAGNDTLDGGAGNDRLDGGEGLDTAIYNVSRSVFHLLVNGDGTLTVQGADGVDTLTSVERVRLYDGTLAFDVDGAAGSVFRLYQAAFDRRPDAAGLGYWVDKLDREVGGLTWVAKNFLLSSEFREVHGDAWAMSSDEFVTLLYNVGLGRAPDAAGFDYHMAELAAGGTREAMLACFAQSPENYANLADAVAGGMWFI